MQKNAIKIILGILLLNTVAIAHYATAGGGTYILPNADYNLVPPSAPCLVGVISSVTRNKVVVKSNGRARKIEVSIIAESSIFTVYGGYVRKEELKPGIKLKVWYKGKSCNKPERPLKAARIMVASKRPGDDWP